VKYFYWCLVFCGLFVLCYWLWNPPQSSSVLPPSPTQIATSTLPVTTTPTPTPDPRIAALQTFFASHDAVSPQPITDYLNAADQNNLDYRILPAISVQESQGGVHACGNNWWGWDSCKGDNFGSVTEGIQYIAQQLASGNYYRGKTIDQKLRAYNPHPAYAGEVERLMKEISP
jgi:hypothetical protein